VRIVHGSAHLSFCLDGPRVSYWPLERIRTRGSRYVINFRKDARPITGRILSSEFHSPPELGRSCVFSAE